MQETRLRRDGPDLVASIDAFKITRHGHEFVEWRVAGLYGWSRAILREYHEAAIARGDNPGALRDGGLYVAERRADAVMFCEDAARHATKSLERDLRG